MCRVQFERLAPSSPLNISEFAYHEGILDEGICTDKQQNSLVPFQVSVREGRKRGAGPAVGCVRGGRLTAAAGAE